MKWILAAAFCSAALGASVVATVDSSAPFLVGGKRVPAVGVGSWPVLAGDRVATQGSGALVSFRGGSYVALDKNSEVLLTEKDGKIALKLVKGKLSYKMGEASDLVFESVAKTARTGTLAVENGSVAYFAQFELGRKAAAPGTYPIQINWDLLPPGVTTSPGPEPVSGYR